MLVRVIMKISYILLIIAFAVLSIDAQVKGLSSLDMEDFIKDDMMDKLNSEQMFKAGGILVGNVVEPDYYFVGPGDVLLIQNLTSMSTNEAVIITPENFGLIPRIGTVSLKGMTLTEARKTILNKIKEWNPEAIAYVTLYKSRTVVVTISGNVAIPGTYTFPASFKISTLLKFANQKKSSNRLSMYQSAELLEKNQYNQIFEKMFVGTGMPVAASFSKRNITVIHSDGSYQIADIIKAAVSRELYLDPYIREGDEIFVPYNTDNYPVISIAGGIVRPYITAFKEGDKASMLLKFGVALNDNADKNNIQLILPISNTKKKLDVDNNLEFIGEDIELEPGSIIIIGQKERKAIVKQGVVSLVGNLNNPGVYPIISGQTRLKEAIEMAGGFSGDAYLPLAYILRSANKNENDKTKNLRLIESFQYSDLSMLDTARFLMDIFLKKPIVSCDFVAAFDEGSERDNVILQNGDVIKIPSNPRTVYIFGQVKNPGYVLYEKNKSMEWYIKSAGGYAESADISRARIIRGRTKVWIDGEGFVYAGDEIYVPAPENVPPGVEAQTWGMILGAVGAVAGLGTSIYWWTQ